MAQYTEYHPLKFWLDPASIAEIVAHIQTYLVNNPINSTTEIETIIHDYLIAHPELIGGVESVNGETGEVVLTADNISGGENVTIKDVLDSLQDQINDIVISIPSDYQQLIDDVSDLNSAISDIEDAVFEVEETELSPVGTITTKYVYNFSKNTSVESDGRAWGKYIVNGEQNLKISGGSALVVPNYALCGAFDVSDNLLGTFGITASTDYTEFEITTPSDTAYIIVNGTYRVVSGERVLVIGAKEVIVTKSSAIVQKEYVYKVVGNVIYDRYMNNNTLEPMENKGGCNYLDFVLGDGEVIQKLKFSGKQGNSTGNFYALTFYDINNTILGHYGEANTEYTDTEITDVPEGTKRIIVNGVYYNAHTDMPNPYKKKAQLAIYREVDIFSEDKRKVQNTWYGKKITLLGTSVAYGQMAWTNYIEEASKLLGFDVFNTGVPGMSITINGDGTPVGNTGYSSVLSLAEYSALGITVPSDPSDSQYYCSWERIFSTPADNTDLFIFACIPNNTNFDLTDWNAFNKETWSYSSGTFADHRQTFLGGLLFLMDKMYAYKSDARMALIIDSSIGLSARSKTALSTISDYYNIPLIDLWGQMQTTPQMLLLLKSVNGTNNHPSTYAHKLMGKILAGKLLSVF